jgi:hypothetical protein
VPKEEKKPGTKVKINPKIIAEFEKEGIPLGYDSPEEYYNDFYGPMLKEGGMPKSQKANLGGLIGLGADKLLKDSEGARSFTKNLGLAGQLVGKYYDKKADSKDKTTGAEQTKQITAKRDGGMVRGGRAEIKGTRPAKLT